MYFICVLLIFVCVMGKPLAACLLFKKKDRKLEQPVKLRVTASILEGLYFEKKNH